MRRKRKILFAVGGTGGHLLPAQALAEELQKKNPDLDILFAGKGLGTNVCFHKKRFTFFEIKSASPYRDSLFKAFVQLFMGFFQSLRLVKNFSPDCVIGFGSFYSFPILLSAKWKKIPYILIEPNAYPGKVNRFFSSKALVSALQFKEASTSLKGKIEIAQMPLWMKREKQVTKEEAKTFYQLDPNAFTVLIFGGSQGAEVINRATSDLGEQVIHFCGRDIDPENLKKEYASRGIKAHVKQFEENMHLAYAACDLCICRAGGGTIAELIAYAIPAILIPWPGASDDHQKKNAKVLAKLGVCDLLEQKDIENLKVLLQHAKEKREEMRKNFQKFKQSDKELSEVILTNIKK